MSDTRQLLPFIRNITSHNLLNSCKTFVGQLLARGINFFHKNEKFKKNLESSRFIESYKAPANTKIMFWPLALCDTHTYWVSHSQSPTWCHPQSVLVTFGLDPTDWLASDKILSYRIQVFVLVYLHILIRNQWKCHILAASWFPSSYLPKAGKCQKI